MVDLSKEREALRRLAERENEQIARAHAALAGRGPLRLSDFEQLEAPAFDLLLDLLGRAVTASVGSRGKSVTASSSDGSLAIVLTRPDDGAEAVLATPHGLLRGPDFQVTIREHQMI
jgi:hypothetical protein